EDVDPDLAATADLARHRDTSGLDLPVRHPARLERLQAEVARLDVRLTLRGAGAAAALVLAELRLLRQQHGLRLLVLLLGRALGGRFLLGSRLLRGRLLRGRLLGGRGLAARGLRRRLLLLGALVARLVELRWI